MECWNFGKKPDYRRGREKCEIGVSLIGKWAYSLIIHSPEDFSQNFLQISILKLNPSFNIHYPYTKPFTLYHIPYTLNLIPLI